MFYVGCHRPTTTLLLYLGLGQAVNSALAEFKVWRCLGEVDVRWLTNLFNKIWLAKKDAK